MSAGQIKHRSQAEYDRSRIFDIRPKPKFSFEKIRPSAEGISRSRRYEISFSSPNSEVECIKYDILDFCNPLLVTFLLRIIGS